MLNKTEHLLVCLAEECAEISKDTLKALRFGIDDHHPDDPLKSSNKQKMMNEINDLVGVIELLKETTDFEYYFDREKIDAKKAKVLRYMKYAQNRGTLEGEV